MGFDRAISARSVHRASTTTRVREDRERKGKTPLLELLRETRRVLERPIVAAGGIADATTARAALDAGADAVACGTAFLVAHEADVHPTYRDACCKQPRRTPYSPQSSTSVGRMRLTASFEMTPTPRGNQPVVPHAARVMVKVRSWQLVTARRSCATATRSRRAAPWERLTHGALRGNVRRSRPPARGRQRDHRGARSSSHVALDVKRHFRTLGHAAYDSPDAWCGLHRARRPHGPGQVRSQRPAQGTFQTLAIRVCLYAHERGPGGRSPVPPATENPELHVCTSS